MVSKKIYVFKWVKLPWQNEFCFSQIAIKKKEIGKVHLRTRGIPLLTNLFCKLVCFLQKENKGSPVSVVSIKVEKILKGSLDSIPSPSPSVKIQIMGGKICMRCKGKTLLGVVNKLLKTKNFCRHHSAMFCLITSSKLSRQWFELSLKMMGLNPGYLLKSFLLYCLIYIVCSMVSHESREETSALMFYNLLWRNLVLLQGGRGFLIEQVA